MAARPPASWQPSPPRAGRYLVCLAFRPAKAQATNTPVTIRHAGGTTKLTVDQRKETTSFNFVRIGEFIFQAGDAGFLEVSNGSTDGRVAIAARAEPERCSCPATWCSWTFWKPIP